jgi:hypothetical protein
MIEDAHRLLSFQLAQERELDNKYKFAGLSVDQFISRLLIEGFSKRAEKVRNDFKVPDKRWWWVKLKALAGNKDWDGLEAFAKSKKSPIGYEPFVVSVAEPRPGKVDVEIELTKRHICLLSVRHNLPRRPALFLDVIRKSGRICMSCVETGGEQRKLLVRGKTRPS